MSLGHAGRLLALGTLLNWGSLPDEPNSFIAHPFRARAKGKSISSFCAWLHLLGENQQLCLHLVLRLQTSRVSNSDVAVIHYLRLEVRVMQ